MTENFNQTPDEFNVLPESIESAERAPTSGDLWYGQVVLGKGYENFDSRLVEILKSETPQLCSAILERTCNLQCTHCVFPEERSSKDESDRVGLTEIVTNIMRQLPGPEDPPHYGEPLFTHEGRILRPWHLDVFASIREARPDARIGLIDNGTYVKHIPAMNARNLKLDRIDISLDGTEEVHNRQRDPIHKTSYRETIEGLRRAREIVRPQEDGGSVTSLFTLTKLNFREIEKVADILFSPNPDSKEELPYVDTFAITTMSPAREPNKLIEVSPKYREGDVAEFQEAWQQMVRVSARYNTPENQRFHLSIFRSEDIEKLALAVGPVRFLEALEVNPDVKYPSTTFGEIRFEIDGVVVSYHPLSMWPNETFLIDADGRNEVAYSLQYTLDELKSGKAKDGTDTTGYTVANLTAESELAPSYHRVVDQWWGNFGKQHLAKEAAMFERLRERR